MVRLDIRLTTQSAQFFNKGKSGNGKGKFKGKCSFCGMKGHKEKDCFEKPENASKRPMSWKSKMEQANVTNDKEEEFLLMAKDIKKKSFKATIDLLSDPNVLLVIRPLAAWE